MPRIPMDTHIPSSFKKTGDYCPLLASYFFDPGGLASPLTQVIKLRSAHGTPADNFDFVYLGSMDGKSTFNANTVGYPAQGEGFPKAGTTPLNYHAFKNLNPLPGPFHNPNMGANGVTGFKIRDISLNLFFFQLFDDIAHGLSRLLLKH